MDGNDTSLEPIVFAGHVDVVQLEKQNGVLTHSRLKLWTVKYLVGVLRI